MRHPQLLLVALVGCTLAGPAQATYFHLSTFTSSNIGGQPLTDGDVGRYNAATDTATVALSESIFDGPPPVDTNVDAFSILANGNYLLSVTNQTIINGTTYFDGDLIEYDPLTDTASLYFDETLFFTGSVDIDAVHVFSDGTFLLSTTDTETLGGLTFRDGDIAHYDPVADSATLFFDEDLFADDENIDGFAVMADGSVALSTADDATLAGLVFRDGDVVAYDMALGIATLIFSEDAFAGNENVDALHTPEPGSAALLALGLAALAAARRRAA